MSSQWGEYIKISIFGESHGPLVGVTMDGLPSGLRIEESLMEAHMRRRAPSGGAWSTKRKEDDSVRIVSGVYQGHTTGTPLCAVIENRDARSSDYERQKSIPRPGHADYTGEIRYRGYQDGRGGGHFSGRLTAPLTFAGFVAECFLKQRGVVIGAHIRSIGSVTDRPSLENDIDETRLNAVKQKPLAVFDDQKGEAMQDVIEKVRRERDSIGGQITVYMLNVPAGIGNPIFGALESKIAQLALGVPGIKGIYFGDEDMAGGLGSEKNDAFTIKNDAITLCSNHNGGITGGITNGQPVVFTVAVKPTSSIGKVQKSVDMSTMQPTEFVVRGRHDPCIVPRAVPVLEAVGALALMDAWAGVNPWNEPDKNQKKP